MVEGDPLFRRDLSEGEIRKGIFPDLVPQKQDPVRILPGSCGLFQRAHSLQHEKIQIHGKFRMMLFLPQPIGIHHVEKDFAHLFRVGRNEKAFRKLFLQKGDHFFRTGPGTVAVKVFAGGLLLRNGSKTVKVPCPHPEKRRGVQKDLFAVMEQKNMPASDKFDGIGEGTEFAPVPLHEVAVNDEAELDVVEVFHIFLLSQYTLSFLFCKAKREKNFKKSPFLISFCPFPSFAEREKSCILKERKRLTPNQGGNMFKVGCAEQILEVPLFVELYGYGFFQGRRNVGVHDPLYCRTFCFNDGSSRAMIVYTDTCVIPDEYAQEMRAKLAFRYKIPAGQIAFVATHTHSAPPLGFRSGVGFGTADPDFQETWKKAVLKTAEKAFLSEEEIEYALAGATPLTEKLGRNRVEVEKNITDETIRFLCFMKKDGSCKALIHNHGIHGIAMNGAWARLVSADWMGAANALIQQEGLAEMPLFLQGPCGDVNTETACSILKNDTAAAVIGKKYVADLKKGIREYGKKITDLTISGTLQSFKFPVKEQTAQELREDAEAFQAVSNQHVLRLKEMSILLEKGYDLNSYHDLQVIKIGPCSFFFIPGEYFVEDGASLMKKSENEFAFAAEVANGDGKYFPSEKDMKRYPEVSCIKTCKNQCAFGFYEIYGYPTGLRFKYQDFVASFVAENLLKLEKNI